MAAFIRVMHKTPDEWYTYPLSALGYISHNKIHRVHISVGGNLYSVAECTSEKECLAVEEAILCNIAASPQGSDLRILDISAIAEHARMTYSRRRRSGWPNRGTSLSSARDSNGSSPWRTPWITAEGVMKTGRALVVLRSATISVPSRRSARL